MVYEFGRKQYRYMGTNERDIYGNILGLLKSKDTKEEISKMTQAKYESLKDFEERFQLSYKRSYTCTLDDDSLKLGLL